MKSHINGICEHEFDAQKSIIDSKCLKLSSILFWRSEEDGKIPKIK
jgi:hypothetical protein